jgi:hypothetical protein
MGPCRSFSQTVPAEAVFEKDSAQQARHVSFAASQLAQELCIGLTLNSDVQTNIQHHNNHRRCTMLELSTGPNRVAKKIICPALLPCVTTEVMPCNLRKPISNQSPQYLHEAMPQTINRKA